MVFARATGVRVQVPSVRYCFCKGVLFLPWVIDDKWMARLAASVQGELDRVSQTLTGRIRELAERYATPLPKLADEVAVLAARVDEHLKRMGARWS